jgi:amino acid carrier protein
MKSVFGIPTWITGIIVLIAVGLVVVGGLKRIASVTEKIVPFMVVIYIVGSVVIFFANISQVGHVFGAIFKGAFALSAAGGGIVGYGIKLAIEQGMKRGVFSNEAGLGSSVMVHSNSNVKEPVRQGMWGIFEVFADTIVVCTLTAFSVLSSGLVNLDNGEAAAFINQTTQVSYYEAETVSDIPDWVNSLGENQNVIFYEDHNGNLTFAQVTDEKGAETPYFADLTTGEASSEYTDSTLLAITKANMVSTVFSLHFKKVGAAFVAIAIMLFAFSTVLGWSHYGSKACEYLFGEKITMVYKVIFVVLVYGGAVMGDNLAWELADTFNGLMMLPNLIGVLVLSPLVAKITRNYVDRHLKGKNVEPMLSVFPEIQKAHADAVKHGAE